MHKASENTHAAVQIFDVWTAWHYSFISGSFKPDFWTSAVINGLRGPLNARKAWWDHTCFSLTQPKCEEGSQLAAPVSSVRCHPGARKIWNGAQRALSRIKWPLWRCWFGHARGERELPEDHLHYTWAMCNAIAGAGNGEGFLQHGLASEGRAVIHDRQQRCLEWSSCANATTQRSMLRTRTLAQRVNKGKSDKWVLSCDSDLGTHNPETVIHRSSCESYKKSHLRPEEHNTTCEFENAAFRQKNKPKYRLFNVFPFHCWRIFCSHCAFGRRQLLVIRCQSRYN